MTPSRDEFVLAIDDEIGPRESLMFLLKHRYRVEAVDSVEKAIPILQTEKVDVVILDIKMPGEDGITGLRRIRQIDPHVSVIMLTGYGSLETVQRALRLGANDYMTKPFNASDMRICVDRHVAATRMSRHADEELRDLSASNLHLQQELAKRRHLVELGETSTQLVHDLGNLLGAISWSADILMAETEEDDACLPRLPPGVLKSLEVIDENTRRCREMVRRWMNLGRREPTRMKPCEIGKVVSDAVTSCTVVATAAGVRLTIAGDRPPCEILGDELQLFRALQNLISNGINAAAGEGGDVRLDWSVRSETELEIRVMDNGHGILPEAEGRLFDPFYTTSERADRIGIGLFIAKKIAGFHDGTVDVCNNPDRGVTATVRLPLLLRQTTAESDSGPSPG